MQQVAARLHAEPNVASVADYYTTGDRGMVSRDGRQTYVAVYFKPRSDKALQDEAKTIEAVPDRTPEVEVQVEGLRKSDAGYLITPVAQIPFVGRAIDDYGLERVEYEANYEPLESPKVAASRAAITAGLTLLPTLPAGPAPVPAYVPLMAQPAQRTELPPAPLTSFAQLVAERSVRLAIEIQERRGRPGIGTQQRQYGFDTGDRRLRGRHAAPPIGAASESNRAALCGLHPREPAR